MLRFDGKVVVVTGAGGGLGREYAILFGERGASVVVNDLGGGMSGGGGSRMADNVVAEITRNGGKAVANYDSVENGEGIVKTALDHFGRVDIVVNNAGILRDKSFQNMTDQDWDLVHKVHLKGTYAVTKAAWPHMKKQQYGRVIVTSSNSGVYGNFGQANYSAAKLGLIGLCNTLSIEGAKSNIYCNSLVPSAGSRLTKSVMPEELLEALKPELVAPLVVWLCHESCKENGGVFEAAGGWFGKLLWSRSEGKSLLPSHGTKITPEAVRNNWATITDMRNSKMHRAGQSQEVLAQTVAGLSSSNPVSTSDSRALVSSSTLTYEAKDAMLYALAVGASEKQLPFVYENHEKFSVLPTFAVVPGLRASGACLAGADIPNVKVDLLKVLHGEQYYEFYRPFPSSGTVTTECTIADVMDKGSGATILTDVTTRDEHGNKLAFGQYTTFVVGAGNFGGKRTSTKEKPTMPVPKRSPDAVVEQKTMISQAAFYRIASGDFNPLHIDPSFANLAGFDQPILHGLCSFGFSVRHVLERFGGSDVANVKQVKARFAKPVIPGQTLITEMWQEGNRVHFQTKVKETGQVAISGGYVLLAKAASSGSVDTVASSKAHVAEKKSSGGLKSAEVFAQLSERLRTRPEIAKQVNAVFLWVITKDGKEVTKWTVDLRSAGGGGIYEGEPKSDAKPGVTLTLSDDDMADLVAGKLNAQQAFMSGKLKLKGNIMLTQKLQGLLKDEAKL